MTDDATRKACLDVALDMARTGTFRNYLEVEQALSVSRAGCWDESLTEATIRERIDKLCAEARRRDEKHIHETNSQTG